MSPVEPQPFAVLAIKRKPQHSDVASAFGSNHSQKHQL